MYDIALRPGLLHYLFSYSGRIAIIILNLGVYANQIMQESKQNSFLKKFVFQFPNHTDAVTSFISDLERTPS